MPDLDDDLLQDDATAPDSPVEVPEEGAPKPAHSPLSLAMAEELGIPDAGQMSPESLNAAILAARQAIQKANAPKPVVEEEQDAPLDYGVTDDGRPITNDAEYAAEWGKANLRALKLAHQADVRATKAEKRNAKLEQSLTQERDERNRRRVMNEVHKIMATRPDIYGTNPGDAPAGTAEAKRYQLTMLHLQSLGANAKGPKVDMPEAMELFGPTPEPVRDPKTGRFSPTDFANSSLARPNNRRHADNRSDTEKRVERKAQEMEGAGLLPNGYVPGRGNDDDDLLD